MDLADEALSLLGLLGLEKATQQATRTEPKVK